MKGFFSKIGCLTFIALLLAGGWWFRDDISDLWRRLQITSSSRPSEQLAERAADKLQSFAEGDAGSSLRLSQQEMQSLLTYRADPMLPPGISAPLVELRDSTLVLSARVDPEQLEGLASPELVERFLSDSTRVLVELEPGVLAPGVARVEVVTLQAGSVVIPSLMVPWILESMALEGAEVEGTMLLMPLPLKVQRFAVEDGELLLDTD